MIPDRAWRRFIHRGADQFHSTDMVAETSSMRTRVASMTLEHEDHAGLLDRQDPRQDEPADDDAHEQRALVMMILPERCRPSRTASLVEWPCSCSSTMRESRKT